MLFTALLFGLMSSFHCIGMCGPIAMMLPLDRSNPTKKIIQISTYHLGRLLSYSILGLVFGILGKGFFLAGFQQQLSIAVGITIILITLIPEKTFAKYNFSKPIYRLISSVKTRLGQQFKKKSFGSIFMIGVFNGLLPCPMVYVALFGAIAMQTPTLGMLYMFLFGLGTLPLMTLVVLLSTILQFKFRFILQKILPILAVIIGILFILRGLGLDIHYLSPSTMDLFVKENADCVAVPLK